METSSQARLHQDIRLISHNVFWFQGSDFPTDVPPAPRMKILEQLCLLYRELQGDVLCLQEIQSEAVAQKVAEFLGMEYLFRTGGGYPQYGGAIFSRWPMKERTHIEGFIPDRILLQAQIFPNDAPPFSLVNIHLPSNRQRGAVDGLKQRLLEVSHVLEQADILAGDFNEAPGGPCGALLKQHHYKDVAKIFSAREIPNNLSANFRGDYIWISENKHHALREYFSCSKERLLFCEKNQNPILLSDHLPLGCVISDNRENE